MMERNDEELLDAIESAPKRVSRAQSFLLTIVLLVMAVAYAAGPGIVQITHGGDANRRLPEVSPQVEAPFAVANSAAVRHLQSLPPPDRRDPPLILAYHNIESGSKSRYTVTPENFASQMALLKQAGYQTITPKQLAGWLDGKPLPRRAVMLTFDDGVAGIWRHADSVLARYGFRATVFVITGSVRESIGYYLTWAELHRMAKSGRWDLEAHTDRGHRYIRIDGGGQQGPFLTNRAWLPDAHRLETLAEYQSRITADFAASRAAFVRHGFPAPRFFAYPFSAITEPTNDPAAPPLLRRFVQRTFRAAMHNHGAGVMRPEYVAQLELNRIEVFSTTGIATFVKRLSVASQVPLRAARRPFARPLRWIDTDGHQIPQGFVHDTLTMAPPKGHWIGANYVPERSSFWANYTVWVRIRGLGRGAAGTEGGLRILADSRNQIQISLSPNWLSVRQGHGQRTHDLGQRSLALEGQHDLRVTIFKHRLIVLVDGRVCLDRALRSTPGFPLTGGIGLTAVRRGSRSPALEFVGLRISPAHNESLVEDER